MPSVSRKSVVLNMRLLRIFKGVYASRQLYHIRNRHEEVKMRICELGLDDGGRRTATRGDLSLK